MIADPLVRNRATVGGNLAHADPANDHPATMLALGAEVTATGPKGQRTIPIEKFFTGIFSTALAPDEILTEIRIPIPPARSGGAYVKLERKVGDFATAAAAAQVTLGPGGDIVTTDQFTKTIVGFRYMVNDPGVGVTIRDVGRITYGDLGQTIVLWQAGEHDLALDAAFQPTFCAALA